MAALASTRRALAPFRFLASFALALGVFGGLGCQPQIGDPCRRTYDCGLRVIRQCDVSNSPRDPKNQGECILENCSYGVCPNEAVCVKVYSTELLSIACEPEAEDVELACDAGLTCVEGTCRNPPNEPNDTGEDETGETGEAECLPGSVGCPCFYFDNCLPHEVCLPEGLCADEVRARTSCRRQCNNDNDCRDNYECVSTGAGGVYMAPDPADPTQPLTDSICVPR
jgi:hypothetical protein